MAFADFWSAHFEVKLLLTNEYFEDHCNSLNNYHPIAFKVALYLGIIVQSS